MSSPANISTALPGGNDSALMTVIFGKGAAEMVNAQQYPYLAEDDVVKRIRHGTLGQSAPWQRSSHPRYVGKRGARSQQVEAGLRAEPVR